MASATSPTALVLAHGAFADVSSRSRAVARLIGEGVSAVGPPKLAYVKGLVFVESFGVDQGMSTLGSNEGCPPAELDSAQTAFGEPPAFEPGWKSLPNRFVVADHAISPDADSVGPEPEQARARRAAQTGGPNCCDGSTSLSHYFVRTRCLETRSRVPCSPFTSPSSGSRRRA